MQSKTERFEMRFNQHTLNEIDLWRSQQSDLPSRAEAVRRLIERGLLQDAGSLTPKRFTEGETLAIFMLCDIHRHLKVDGGVDPKFVEDALSSGMTWGLRWKYPGIFHQYEVEDAIVSEVVDFLDMWSFIEEAFEKLSQEDRKRIESMRSPFAGVFEGFDGNNETHHRGAALFMVESLKRFTRFAGRDLNSHWPVVDAYRRMYAKFASMRTNLIGRPLSADELIALFSAGR